MNRQAPRLTRPPALLRQRGVRLDNVALVPASMLPFKQLWQHLANELPPGDILICIPQTGQPLRGLLWRLAELLRARGHHVRAISTSRFAFEHELRRHPKQARSLASLLVAKEEQARVRFHTAKHRTYRNRSGKEDEAEVLTVLVE